ncbi:hypothetical protein CC117_32565 [Parafrankia colletiae]|uniref:Uncharacterized protein n=1 Tax=Parafrankia colletiae TaxID=573497 RepID=A0A1S1RA91_9ACTN|nr:hypothetical protein [Parafrankia colletiae]MCK9904361.1 hypothetical protein [Frankia sp. Cpl3]OHV43748.1 hypothetical protein CC117_32565 [Parafrankia colletiae]
MIAPGGDRGGREIRTAGLDPDRDWLEIVRLLVFHEFPWDARTAGKLTIWHLFAVPSTASVVGSIDALGASCWCGPKNLPQTAWRIPLA